MENRRRRRSGCSIVKVGFFVFEQTGNLRLLGIRLRKTGEEEEVDVLL